MIKLDTLQSPDSRSIYYLKKSESALQVKTKKVPVSKLPVRKSTAKDIKPFPIVAFGASAGGLEAFTSLLKHLDSNLGMAYVLIMHLSPKHDSALTEILQFKTNMPVHQVQHGMELNPNNIYVIPPNTFMSISDGHLKLAPRSIDNFAVDYFMVALASLYKNNAIGVILSGTATDGTLGLKAIKAGGGITFAQDDTAKFSGMPHHAYDAGYVDFRLPPEGIAHELARLTKNPYTISPSDKIEELSVQEAGTNTDILKKILSIVKSKTGIDFFHNYKHASVYRRLVRRMVLNKLDTLEDYYSMLKVNPKEVDALYDDFLINVTHFFRDPEFYKILTKQVFPSIVQNPENGEAIRIWVAGCSTGEEAYSISICLIDFLAHKELHIPIQIFASDLDAGAIEKARLGIYPLSGLLNVSQNHLKKYFVKVDNSYQIVKSVRELCVFSQQNLLKDPPFSRMNLISCQNVLIYLETNPQKKILQTFHYALKRDGYLFLGKSETTGNASDLFEPLDKKIRLYSKNNGHSPQLEFTILHPLKEKGKDDKPVQPIGEDVEKSIAKLMLSRYVYPSVVVNKNLMITQFFGATSQYLEPVTGKASFNILKMIREDLVVELGSLLHQVRKTEKAAHKEGIRIHNKNVSHDITIEVEPKKISGETYFLVVFKASAVIHMSSPTNGGPKGTSSNDAKDRTISKLEEELVQSRGLIRTTNEEYETTYEELQANNEEILSSNEELQSVNEELETSKEELQSAVEELTTTNEELRKRNVELDESQQELSRVNEQLKQFAFISSHDLQEPLRKILTFSNLLSQPEADLNSFSKKYSEKISASAFRMSSLLRDLLSFSLLINNDRNFAHINLNDIVSNVLSDFADVIAEKRAIINLSHLPVIYAEPIQMGQLFSNLISNALKFNDGNPVIDITTAEATQEVFLNNPELKSGVSYVCIRVTDNGIGFDEQYKDKIFELFQRLNDKKNAEGTGLGLAICRKIVKNHRGSIRAHSANRKGATFTVFLPSGLPA